MHAAAAARSTSPRNEACASTKRASFTMSRLRPSAQKQIDLGVNSSLLAKTLEGLRAPLATARKLLPSSARNVTIRSPSPSFVLRSTRALARKSETPCAYAPCFITGSVEAMLLSSFHAMEPLIVS